MELQGKVALITGAGSGIGRATALRMAEEGADIAALSVVEKEVADVCAEIEKLGRKALPLVADVSSDRQMKDAFQAVKDAFGRLDIVYANAGINGVWAPIEELTVDEWDRVHAINLRGTFLTVRNAIPLMKQRGGAMIVTASITGTTAFIYAGSSAYGATKMGQISFMKSAALELARYKIRVNAVCPGGIATNINSSTIMRNNESVRFPVEHPQGQIPLGRQRGEAEDVAEVVLFLASDRSRHVTGMPVYVDGGQSLVV